jgi:general secretion pathway protein H
LRLRARSRTGGAGPGGPDAGFTLIELLVVLVLVGIILTFAVLSVGDGGKGRQLELEARRINALLGLAAEEAILTSRQMGVEFSAAGYRFLYLGQGGWKPVTDDQTLRARSLPEGMRLELTVEDVGAKLPTEFDDKKATPQVLLSPSGEQTPFELRLKLDDGRHYTLTGRFGGGLKLSGPQSGEGA